MVMGEHLVFSMAREMRGDAVLSQELSGRLARVIELMKNYRSDGTLRSTQVVAAIIMQWELDGQP